MASKVPSGYKDLCSASTQINADVNVIGIVTDVRPPSRSKGPDWVCTFSISDSTYSESDEGLLVRYFRPTETELPRIQGTGDVVILRNIKVKQWSGRTIAMSGRLTSWIVFASDSIPEKAPPRFQLTYVKDPRAPAPQPIDMEYAISLCNSRDRSVFRKISDPYSNVTGTSPSQGQSSVHTPTPRRGREKFSMIKDVQIDNYYDLVGQVVKLYPSNGNVELYITDYTSNPLLYNYEWGLPAEEDTNAREGDEFGYIPHQSANRKWPGPFGRHTLTITLWPSHCYFAQSNVKENDFVYLRNVHIRYSKDAKVEGSMHTDTKYPDKVDINIISDHRDDDRVKNVLRRKLEYSEKFKVQSQSFINSARGQKRRVGDNGKQMSKNQARKKRKQQKDQALRPKSREQDIEQSDEMKTGDSVIPQKLSKQELNKNIHCSHNSIPPRSLSSILSLDTHGLTTPRGTPFTLPFQNINSRATVRIIDFFPPNIADFAVPCPPASEYDVLSEHESSDLSDNQSDGQEDKERRWEWRFGLVLEDARGSKQEKKAQMKVYVADQDAVFLLKLDAEDLRASPLALSSLREKLFLLWGDLEELKSQAKPTNNPDQDQDHNQAPTPEPKSKPFECCLKEYGIRVARKMPKREDEVGGGDEEGDVDDEEGRREQQENFGWERRWRFWGTTIV